MKCSILYQSANEITAFLSQPAIKMHPYQPAIEITAFFINQPMKLQPSYLNQPIRMHPYQPANEIAAFLTPDQWDDRVRAAQVRRQGGRGAAGAEGAHCR